MTCDLAALCFDARDPLRLARFWSGVLGWAEADTDQREDGVTLLPSDDTGFRIRFLSSQEQKAGPNQMHFDLAPSVDSGQQAEVDRLISLGATRIDIGQGDVDRVVLADPDGNEFCVLTRR